MSQIIGILIKWHELSNIGGDMFREADTRYG